MRRYATLCVLFAGSFAFAQAPIGADVVLEKRYGVAGNLEFYPQSSAKDALASAAKLLEKKRYSYILAHIVDPAFVDDRVAKKAAKLSAAVEKRLDAKRSDQKASAKPGLTIEEQIPLDPFGFAERVKAEATQRAFDELVKELEANLSEAPEQIAQLMRFAKEGVITENGPTASAAVKEIVGKQVFLKQAESIGFKEGLNLDGKPALLKQTVTRWHLEDRQTEVAK